MSIACDEAWHTQSRAVRTEIQPELGHFRRDERASGDGAEADGRIHVGASVEGGGRGHRQCAVHGALDGRVEQVTRTRKGDRRRCLRECLVERVRVLQSCKFRMYGTRARARKAKRISTRQPSCPMNMNRGNETSRTIQPIGNKVAPTELASRTVPSPRSAVTSRHRHRRARITVRVHALQGKVDVTISVAEKNRST